MKKLFYLLVNTVLIILGYKYVEFVKDVKDKAIYRYQIESDILYQWLAYKQNGKSIPLLFEKKGWKKIAIYGMNEMGCRLYDELKDSDVVIEYAIDQTGVSSIEELCTIDNTEPIKDVDVIVVCIMFAYNPVKKMLMEKTDCPIVSIEDIIFED